jgi:hypothetical protein
VSTSEVSQIGRDSYIVGTTARGGLSSTDAMTASIKRGTNYCAALGKKFFLDHTQGSGVAGWTPVTSEITFQCLDESDPAYRRAYLRKDADTVIEQRR